MIAIRQLRRAAGPIAILALLLSAAAIPAPAAACDMHAIEQALARQAQPTPDSVQAEQTTADVSGTADARSRGPERETVASTAWPR